jgi:hypothetical protein
MSINAAGECVGMKDSTQRWMRSAAFVFDGTVTRVEDIAPDGTRTNVDDYTGDLNYRYLPGEPYLREYAATFQVHRVWKGKVPKEFTVYFVPNWDGPSFKKGQRQIVFAMSQTPETPRPRHSNSLGQPAPMPEPWVEPCTGLAWDNKNTQLGRSHKPSS